MKKLFYDEGMPAVGFGKAGEFRINEPKEVPDDLAAELLRKGRLKEWTEGKAEGGKRKAEVKSQKATDTES